MEVVLETVMKVLLTVFYFLIQETSLTIMVCLRFQIPREASAIACGIIFCLMLLLYMLYLSFNPLWFFPNPATQYVSIWRKIAMPIFVIVPPEYTFLIIVMLLVFVVLESFFDYKGGDFKLLSRITFFKLLELLVLIMCFAYFLT